MKINYSHRNSLSSDTLLECTRNSASAKLSGSADFQNLICCEQKKSSSAEVNTPPKKESVSREQSGSHDSIREKEAKAKENTREECAEEDDDSKEEKDETRPENVLNFEFAAVNPEQKKIPELNETIHPAIPVQEDGAPSLEVAADEKTFRNMMQDAQTVQVEPDAVTETRMTESQGSSAELQQKPVIQTEELSYRELHSNQNIKTSASKPNLQTAGDSVNKTDGIPLDQSGVKIKNFELSNGKNATAMDNSQPALQNELLNRLNLNQSNYAMAASKSKHVQNMENLQVRGRGGNSESANISVSVAGTAENTAETSGIFGNYGEVSAFGGAPENMAGGEENPGADSSFERMQNQKIEAAESLSNSGARAQNAGRSSGAEVAHNIEKGVQYVQELVAKLQHGLLRGGEGVRRGEALKMDVEVSGLGSLSLSVQQSGETLSVTMQTGSDSTKDQLMDQQEEFQRQMRELGYQNVELNIQNSSDRGESYRQARDQAFEFSNSASVENVRLSGNAAADRAAALA